MKKYLLTFPVSMALCCQAIAATYYVDPASTEDNLGTEADPWTSISTALASVSGGDTILLASGDYGSLEITNYTPASRVTLEALDDAQFPKFDFIYVGNSTNLRFSQILVQPDDYTAENNCDVSWKSKALVCIDNGSSSITIEKSVIDSGESLEELSALDLDAQDQGTYTYDNSNLRSFFEYKLSGIAVWNNSNDILISNNQISNLNIGIQLYDIFYATVSGNYIASIKNGLHGKIIDDIDIDDNYFKHFYGVLEDDGDLTGGSGINLSYGYETLDVIKDITITNNVLLPYDLTELSSTVDGNKTIEAGIFHSNSHTEDWTVEYNIVASGKWHSISIYGTDHLNLRYNLEVDMNADDQFISNGIKIYYENEYDSDKVDISCNIASRITESGEITTNTDILSRNTISTFTNSEDWATDANSQWPSDCAVELGYKLITKDI